MDFTEHPNGFKQIKVLRVRWAPVAAGAPKLFLEDNYTFDGHEKPLSYAIAPGAWVYDISQGWADTFQTGGWLDATDKCPRKLKVTPHSDRGTKFDFQPGDEIEQAVGADPWHPRPLRIRQFDQMPTTMDNATIEIQQEGRVQVPTGISISGITRRMEDLKNRKDGRPSFDTILKIESVARQGIYFGSEVLDSAIFFAQPGNREQPLRWHNEVNDHGYASALTVPPATGNFVFTGGDIDYTDSGSLRQTGISATGTAARNLRGINVAVAADAKTITVTFSKPEADADYSITVQPNWFTMDRVVKKTDKGFGVEFSQPAGAGAAIDWQLIR
jgi:hypothetical protein